VAGQDTGELVLTLSCPDRPGIFTLVDELDVELVVLARYMQVLSPVLLDGQRTVVFP
jgi:formyltetrahydrofolate hydrolase